MKITLLMERFQICREKEFQMIFKWRLKKYDYKGQIYYMPQRKGWIFWNNATWDEYRKVYYEESSYYFSSSNKIEVPGLGNNAHNS